MESVSFQVVNNEAVDLSRIINYSMLDWRQRILNHVSKGARISNLFAVQIESELYKLYVILSNDQGGKLAIFSTELNERSYLSLTPECIQAHRFECEIFEKWGINPQNHPAIKPIRNPVEVSQFYKIDGHEIHEVAVGPVHAGVIEPGHFRFQCFGENVFNLEIALGYQHRGIEKAIVNGPSKRTLHYMETAVGDTTIGHTLAYCQAVESLGKIAVPTRAKALRQVALELERIANHVGDLGALAADVGYLPTASFCGRLRGDYLNLTALLCGSRVGRGFICPGGVAFDVDAQLTKDFLNKLNAAFLDTTDAVDLLWQRPSVITRFEQVGIVSQKLCIDLGLVGPAARACGVMRDVRKNNANFSISTHHTGDVFARAYVRWLEIKESVRIIQNTMSSLPSGEICNSHEFKLDENKLVVSLVEGWRGEICHVAIIGKDGKFLQYKITDPSFHNWSGLEMALRNQQISDFPLCNKSFNLSYCGHDL